MNPMAGAVRIVVVSLLACVLLAYLGYRCLFPYNTVATDIEGISPNTRWVCLVADTKAGLRVMEWHHTKVLQFTMHPANSIVSSLREDETFHHATVRWVYGKRIGVLSRSVDRDWTVAWFDAAGVELTNRSFLFGGGSVNLFVAEAESVEAVTTSQLKELGMR